MADGWWLLVGGWVGIFRVGVCGRGAWGVGCGVWAVGEPEKVKSEK